MSNWFITHFIDWRSSLNFMTSPIMYSLVLLTIEGIAPFSLEAHYQITVVPGTYFTLGDNIDHTIRILLGEIRVGPQQFAVDDSLCNSKGIVWTTRACRIWALKFCMTQHVSSTRQIEWRHWRSVCNLLCHAKPQPGRPVPL